MSELTTGRRKMPGGRGKRPGENAKLTVVWNAIAVLFALVMGFPIYWMILTTVKSNSDLLRNPSTFIVSPFSKDLL